jgi:hypothetical protein
MSAGRKNVEVTANDLAGNIGAVGKDDATVTGAILFEIDNALPAPAPTPAAGGTVYTVNPFIVIDWSSEGATAEYTGDTHKKVTLSKLTLDGTDVLSQATTADSIKHILPATNLTLAEHTVVVNGADEAGNVLSTDFTFKFTVKARPTYSIPLVPGMNLISFPATPAKTALKDAFTGTSVDLVVTYDPSALAGPWLIGQKAADGSWSGTLASVDNMHGYWVRSAGTAPITVDIPDRGFQELPPAIPVVVGWNLVPVVDVAGSLTIPNFPRTAGTTALAATNAFAGATWNVGYWYSPLAGNWGRFTPTQAPDLDGDGTFNETGEGVLVGSAYWVYFTAKGTITP